MIVEDAIRKYYSNLLQITSSICRRCKGMEASTVFAIVQTSFWEAIKEDVSEQDLLGATYYKALSSAKEDHGIEPNQPISLDASFGENIQSQSTQDKDWLSLFQTAELNEEEVLVIGILFQVDIYPFEFRDHQHKEIAIKLEAERLEKGMLVYTINDLGKVFKVHNSQIIEIRNRAINKLKAAMSREDGEFKRFHWPTIHS